MKYTFTEIFGIHNPAMDPERVGKELAELCAENDNVLDADDVVAYAHKAARSECAKLFEWDDKQAARRYRRTQARRLISSLQTTVGGKKVRAYVSLENRKGYHNFADVMADQEMRDQLLQTALRKLTSLQGQYKHLSELAKVNSEIERARLKHVRKHA